VYRDLPLAIHPGARPASVYANCAADQGQFWPMHDRLYAGYEANEWGQDRAGDEKVFLGYAQELKLDVEALKRCAAEQARMDQRIDADVEEAHKHYIENTPTFLLNGEKVVGAHTYSTWQKLLDERLANQGQKQPAGGGEANMWLFLLLASALAVVLGASAVALWVIILRRRGNVA
jgi:protein-disulfide isomerase